MRILIFSNLYRPEPTGIGPVTGELADDLAAMGHEVRVIAANPSYPEWKLFDGFPARRWTLRQEGLVGVHRCPVYIPSRITGKGRILHYSSFAASTIFPAAKLAAGFSPDVVFQAAPTLIASPTVLLCARLSGAKAWLHVQDFEVEAGFATGELNGNGAIARAALAYERLILKRFDKVSSISPEMCSKLAEKGVPEDRIVELRNWARIEDIRPQPGSVFRERWNIGDRHVALYSGSIAGKQGIESIIDAARTLNHRNDLVFVICGNGPNRKALEEYAGELGNVQLHDLQPMEELGELLNLATVHLLPQRKDAADLVLPSKLANMLASGKPVVAGVDPGTGIAREIEGAGLACEPENGAAMASAIETLLGDAPLREEMGRIARNRAQDRWSRKEIVERFEAQLRSAQSPAAAAIPPA